MSWHALPAELHLAVVVLLPAASTVALAATSRAAHALCLPRVFAAVSIPSADALLAFARHVPPHYGQYIKSLAVSTKQPHPPCTDALAAILASSTRLQALSLSLAGSLSPQRILPAFARLSNLHSLDISSSAPEHVAPLSERLVVALAASLPALARLSLARITRSALHVDPCDAPHDVPLVMNDFDVPPHPILGTNLSIPNLLRIPSLRSLQIRDTWLSCDTKLDTHASSSLDSLLLTGSMYPDDAQHEALACTAWLRACAPSLRTLYLGTSLAIPHVPSRQPSLALPQLSHLHINASRTTVDTLPDTLAVLSSSPVECITITYKDSLPIAAESDREKQLVDNFARQCALDDLEDWRDAINTFLITRSNQEWSALQSIHISFGDDIHASWDL
ncbi:hypothetical protein F5I97DRAFT_367056 [Phlebopus sp. FC_14]|nr:hypothetical protein F5I97DRAFT_367056 [Phlebopus sp. FC_14]